MGEIQICFKSTGLTYFDSWLLSSRKLAVHYCMLVQDFAKQRNFISSLNTVLVIDK